MKNKLFVCFRPVTMQHDEHDHRDSNLLVVANGRTSKIPRGRSFPFSDKENRRIPRSSSQITHSSRKFCQDLKSILVEASLQKHRSGSGGALMLRSKSHGYEKITHGPQFQKSVEPKYNETKQNSTPSLSSCPRSLSERRQSQSSYPNKTFPRSKSMCLISSCDQQKQSISKGRVPTTSSRSNSGSILFVMSMCVTVFWGKVCGIIFTTILFCCLHRQSCVDRRSEKKLKLTETEWEYNKRVIMEGLLERKHHHS